MMHRTQETNQSVIREVVDVYREDLLGIPVVLLNAVIRVVDESGEETFAIPNMRGLVAAVAMSRCLMPRKIAGKEIRFMRKALEMTGREFAAELDIAPETLSRWENDGRVIGGNGEKMLRHLVCGTLHTHAPAIDFDPSMIVKMKIVIARDAERVDELVFERIKLKDQKLGTKKEEWDTAELDAA